MRAWILVLVLGAFAGCSGPQEHLQGHAMDDTAQGGAQGADEIGPAATALVTSAQLHLTDCRGVAARFVWPGALVATAREVPAGWEDGDAPATDHHVDILECQRVATGGFERGPIRLLLEMHDQFIAPDACSGDPATYNDFRLLRTLWLDDPELVAFLAKDWGMPALLGEFSYSTEEVAGVEARTWTWRTQGQDPSELRYGRVDTIPGGSTDVTRLAWAAGSGVAILDLEGTEDRPAASAPLAGAVLHSPMMHPLPEAGLQSALYSLVDHGDYEGQALWYEDATCALQRS